MSDNRAGDIHGTSIQAHVIHGPVTVHSPPIGAPVPGWLDTALLVCRLDAGELGVHSSVPGSDGSELPPYVVRDVDDELDRRLTTVAASPRGGLVLVAGASTAGKTRALAQALTRTLPDRTLVAPPEDADLRPLPTWLRERAAHAPQGWVVWLDDLDRHLSFSGLTPALVAELGQAGAVVAATIRHHRLQALRPSTTDDDADRKELGYAVLKTPPVVVERRWNSHERERARSSGDDRLIQAAADERFGVAEQLAAGPVLESLWRNGPESGHPLGYALVAAAVALAQAGVSSPLTREQIQTAHLAYLPDPPPLPEEADQAWVWATRQRSGLAGLLVPADNDGRWRAFDYLTIGGALPDSVWRAALDVATDQDLIDVGFTAAGAGREDVTEAAWSPVAEQGDTKVMCDLGDLLRYEWEAKAEGWYRLAAERGDTYGMCELGRLLSKDAGRVGEAEGWLRRAAEKGDLFAMTFLAQLLVDVGRMGEAELWTQLFRRSIGQRE
ncbi:tetratricopeptide repeat protein [Nocardiopsis alba]|uniref:tetratricopeptide repeat protein n=1 Tax=Nocardiopsis alba TaxID=53437 RepID=UPI00340CA8B2